MNITYSECASVALGIQNEIRMLRSIFRGHSGSAVFSTLIHKNMFLEKSY
jgi:hypothetical protein